MIIVLFVITELTATYFISLYGVNLMKGEKKQ